MTFTNFPTKYHRDLTSKGVHQLAVARDLAEKYKQQSIDLERNLLQSLDKGFYDLEDYVVNVDDTFVTIISKETT